MKKMVSLVLLLAVCLAWGAALAAPAAAQNAGLFLHTATDYSPESLTEKWVLSAASLGDTLYVLTDGTLERWAPGMSAPEQVMEDLQTYPQGDIADLAPRLSILFADEQRLLALDTGSGQVWALVDDGDALLEPTLRASLDWSGMLYEVEDGYPFFNMSIADIVAEDGILWLLCFDYEKDAFNPVLLRWDMETGKALEPIQGLAIHALTPYQDGQLLCVLRDERMESTDEPTLEENAPSRLGVFDPITGGITALFDLGDVEAVGLAYDAASNTAYYLDNEALMSLPDLRGPTVVSAYFPLPAPEGFGCGLLDGGMYYVSNSSGVLVRRTDPAGAAEGALTIYGARDTRPMLALVQEHPEALARNASSFYGAEEELAAALQSGADAPDVVILDSEDMSIPGLIDEGLALDLSGNAKVAALVADMAPAYSDFVSQGDALYALPLEINGSLMGYRPDIWASLGLSESDLPQTYGELLDFAAGWESAYAKDHPDIRPFEQVYAKESLLFMLINHYMAYCGQAGIAPDFEGALFAGLVQKLESLPADESFGDGGDDIAEYWYEAVFTCYCPFGRFYTEYDFQPLPLAMDAGAQPVIPVSVRVAMVNPRTAHAEEAALYLGMLTRYLDETGANITLFPGHNEPVPYPFFAQETQARTAELAAAKARLEMLQPEEAAELELEIEFLEEIVARPEDYITQQLVTQAQIDAFRSHIEPYLYVAEPNPLYREVSGEADVYALSRQYLEGVITGEQFLKTIAQRVLGMEPEAH